MLGHEYLIFCHAPSNKIKLLNLKKCSYSVFITNNYIDVISVIYEPGNND